MGASSACSTLTDGHALSGTFSLSYAGHRTPALPSDAAASVVAFALSQLAPLSGASLVSVAEVERSAVGGDGTFAWVVWFGGDATPSLLHADGTDLVGPVGSSIVTSESLVAAVAAVQVSRRHATATRK